MSLKLTLAVLLITAAVCVFVGHVVSGHQEVVVIEDIKGGDHSYEGVSCWQTSAFQLCEPLPAASTIIRAER